MTTATIHVELSDVDRAATDALTQALDDYASLDVTTEYGELLEVTGDRWSRTCEILQTAALIVIALALIL